MENLDTLPGFERLYNRVYLQEYDLPMNDSQQVTSSLSGNGNNKILWILLGVLTFAGFVIFLQSKRRQSHKREDSDLNS